MRQGGRNESDEGTGRPLNILPRRGHLGDKPGIALRSLLINVL